MGKWFFFLRALVQALRAGDARMLTIESAKDELIGALQRELNELKSQNQQKHDAATSTVSLPQSKNIMPNGDVFSDSNNRILIVTPVEHNISSVFAAEQSTNGSTLSADKKFQSPILNATVSIVGPVEDAINSSVSSSNNALLQQIRRQQDFIRQHESQLDELTLQNQLLDDEHAKCVQKREELTLLAQEEKAILLLRQTELEQHIAELNEKLAELETKVEEMNAFSQINLQSATVVSRHGCLSPPNAVADVMQTTTSVGNGPETDRSETDFLAKLLPTSSEEKVSLHNGDV